MKSSNTPTHVTYMYFLSPCHHSLISSHWNSHTMPLAEGVSLDGSMLRGREGGILWGGRLFRKLLIMREDDLTISRGWEGGSWYHPFAYTQGLITIEFLL